MWAWHFRTWLDGEHGGAASGTTVGFKCFSSFRIMWLKQVMQRQPPGSLGRPFPCLSLSKMLAELSMPVHFLFSCEDLIRHRVAWDTSGYPPGNFFLHTQSWHWGGGQSHKQQALPLCKHCPARAKTWAYCQHFLVTTPKPDTIQAAVKRKFNSISGILSCTQVLLSSPDFSWPVSSIQLHCGIHRYGHFNHC